MVQRDYLMRMIEQFVQAVARMLGLIKSGSLEEAKRELDGAYGTLGVSRSMVERLDDASLRLLFGDEKVLVIAMLLDTEGKLLRAEGKEAEAQSLEARAKRLGAPPEAPR
jgi:hypothetical protein